MTSIRMAPVLTLMVIIYFFIGSFAISFHENFFQPPGNDEQIPVTIDYLCYCSLVPTTIPFLACTFIILYSVPHVELVSSSSKVLIGLLITCFLDLSSRFIAWGCFNMPVVETGPISLLVFVYLLHVLLFPNVHSPYININEKYILGFIIIIMAASAGIYSILPIICGFISYIFLAPIYCPNEIKPKQD